MHACCYGRRLLRLCELKSRLIRLRWRLTCYVSIMLLINCQCWFLSSSLFSVGILLRQRQKHSLSYTPSSKMDKIHTIDTQKIHLRRTGCAKKYPNWPIRFGLPSFCMGFPKKIIHWNNNNISLCIVNNCSCQPRKHDPSNSFNNLLTHTCTTRIK